MPTRAPVHVISGCTCALHYHSIQKSTCEFMFTLFHYAHTLYLESDENKVFLETRLSPPLITARSPDMIPRGGLFTSREVCVAGESKLPLYP